MLLLLLLYEYIHIIEQNTLKVEIYFSQELYESDTYDCRK